MKRGLLSTQGDFSYKRFVSATTYFKGTMCNIALIISIYHIQKKILHILFKMILKQPISLLGSMDLDCAVFSGNSNMRQEKADKNIMSLYSPAHSLYEHKYILIHYLSIWSPS